MDKGTPRCNGAIVAVAESGYWKIVEASSCESAAFDCEVSNAYRVLGSSDARDKIVPPFAGLNRRAGLTD
jgi:hypothetical protein